MLRGSCLCGGVKFEIDGPLHEARNCHCSMCRKAHGAAFRTRASVRARDFRYLQGEQLISSYESSPGTNRTFCSRCGSRLITKFAAHRDYYGLPLGILDDDPGVKPELHVHVASKAAWHDITDDLPQHPVGPPT